MRFVRVEHHVYQGIIKYYILGLLENLSHFFVTDVAVNLDDIWKFGTLASDDGLLIACGLPVRANASLATRAC